MWPTPWEKGLIGCFFTTARFAVHVLLTDGSNAFESIGTVIVGIVVILIPFIPVILALFSPCVEFFYSLFFYAPPPPSLLADIPKHTVFAPPLLYVYRLLFPCSVEMSSSSCCHHAAHPPPPPTHPLGNKRGRRWSSHPTPRPFSLVSTVVY